MGLDETFDGSHPEYGYILIINAETGDEKAKLAYRAVEPSERGIVQSHNLTIEEQSGWLHFDITRSENGRMKVFLNGSTILDYTDSNHTSSETINIQVTPGVRLDNIKYSNSIDVTSNESIAYNIEIGLILGSIAVVSIYIIRKKKISRQ